MDGQVFLHIGSGLKWLGFFLSPLLLLPLLTLVVPGVFGGVSKAIIRVLDRCSGVALGGAIASALVLLFAQLLVVILRYALATSFTWLSDIVIFAFAAMFMLGAAAALRDGAHVRVDILRPRFGETGRNWIELAGIYLFLFPICIRILTMGSQGMALSWGLLEGSRESDGLPGLFLFKSLVPLFAILMIAQGLSEALKAALRLTGEMEPEAADHGGVHGT